ncbi:MAG: hypothetical protein DRP87_05600 [Spirochaetes bacterium]|nr:MAG: hypothetical protein DRP87_05600 [Spirochaetota bacterium]
MIPSEHFYKKAKKILATGSITNDEALTEEVRKQFFKTLGELPETMKYDLFLFYRYFCSDLNSLTEKLSALIDIFNMEYDEGLDKLEKEEWIFLKDVVSENALEIDDKTLMYVMKLVVEKGGVF